MSWGPGQAVIEELLGKRELQRVAPDAQAARALVEDGRRHLASAAVIRPTDTNGAFGLAYDGARKACSGLLEAQGLRATSRGGHIAVRDAVSAQFGELSGGGVLRPFDRLRRRRNALEYPDNEAIADDDEVGEAIERANEIVDFAENLVDHLPVY